jgi:glycosyltransferase involved in cell wall biosynthesis
MARILIHSLIFSPDGVSTAYLMADLAKELQKLGHSVTVLTTTPHYNKVESELKAQPLQPCGDGCFRSKLEGIEVWHLTMGARTADMGARSKDYLSFHWRSLKWGLRRRKSFDLVIAPSPPLSIGVIAWMIARWHKAKSIYNVQELYPDFAIHQGLVKKPLAIWAFKKLESFVYNRCSAVTTIADRFTRMVEPRCTNPGKAHTIPNFVDIDFYRPLPRDNDFAREQGLLDHFVVMYAGNIGVAQDWTALLYAAEALRNEPIRFVILGDGTQRDWLAEKVARRNLHNLMLLPYQPRERMAEINASCDVATITMAPKAGWDGFPSKIYTTLACGKPSIVSTEEESELAWIVYEARCGTVVPVEQNAAYTEAVLNAYRRRDELGEEGRRGRRFVEEHYSKRAVALQYDRIIRSLTDAESSEQRH